LRGFVHAHVGWLFRHDQRGSRARYATDLLADPVIRFVDRTFVLCSVAWVSAFGLRAVIGGTLTAGMTGCCKESERVGSQIRGESLTPRGPRWRRGRSRSLAVGAATFLTRAARNKSSPPAPDVNAGDLADGVMSRRGGTTPRWTRFRPHPRPLMPVEQNRVEDRIPSSAGR
jgi:hypothetical protein